MARRKAAASPGDRLGTRRRAMIAAGATVGVVGLGAVLIASPAGAISPFGHSTPRPSTGPASPSTGPATTATTVGTTATTAGPVDLALNRPATGSASCRPGETPAKAFDGTVDGGPADKWCSTKPGAILTVDLGQVFRLASVTVRHASAGGEPASRNTRDFSIRVSSDGKLFRTAAKVRGNTAGRTTTGLDVRGRYVRIVVQTPQQGTARAARIYDVSVQGSKTGGTTTPTSSPTPTAVTPVHVGPTTSAPATAPVTTAPAAGATTPAATTTHPVTTTAATKTPTTVPATTTKSPTPAPTKSTTKPATTAPAATPVSKAKSSCAAVETIVVRGTGESPAVGGQEASTAAAIAAGSPVSAETYGLPYPASVSGPLVGGNYSQSQPVGRTDLVARITQQATACPNQKFVLFGYSQGAWVIGDVLAGSGITALSPALGNKVAAVVLYGDPFFTANQSYDRGTFKTGVSSPNPRSSGALSAYADRIADFCNSDDIICQKGASGSGHDRYAGVYAADAAKFVINHLPTR